jgi:preprotein translocase subunit YajC
MGNLAAAEAASKASGSSSATWLIFIVLIGFGLYFIMIRPQRRRQQQVAQQQNTVAPGAEVRTTAGMYATVVEVDGDDVVLEVAPGVEVRYMKRAIMEVITPGDPVDQVDEEADDSEYEEDDASSAEDGVNDEHDDTESLASEDDLDERASANGSKAKSDSDVF